MRESRMRCHVRSGLKLAHLWCCPLQARDLRYWECGKVWVFAESFGLRDLSVLEGAVDGRAVSARDSSP